MQIAKGPNEDIRPVNVGLLMFCKKPERFFPRTRIELVLHKDLTGKQFEEINFEGPIQHQLRDAFTYIKGNIVKGNVVKRKGKAEADRFYNYPFEAIEETLSNAVYHKSYELGSPIEVQVFPKEITVLSHPGPIPPVSAKILSTQKRIIAREYRNRRIGDFLKELHLTEGRGTGVPTIYNTMANNGSPDPIFETDENTYVLVRLPIHPEILIDEQVTEQVTEQVKNLIAVFQNEHSRNELMVLLGLTHREHFRTEYLQKAIDSGLVELTIPDKPKSSKQKYRLTTKGKQIK